MRYPQLLFWAAVVFISNFHGQAMGQSTAAPRLSLPIACELGKSCFIQNYVDILPGPGVRDYACGSSTYDGHKGVDFRVHSAAQSGVPVLASAAGRVKGVRDEIEDDLDDAGAHKGRECGNGVVIDHGGGWETQYCHMRRRSVTVRKGDVVERGQKLGEVGYSGMAEFAHVHLSVRHNGAVIDPFSGQAPDGKCSFDPGSLRGIWDDRSADLMRYEPGRILTASFTAALPKLDALERNHIVSEPGKTSDNLILFARIMNLRSGDRIRLVITGPSGFEVKSTTDPIERNKAMYLAYAGKRRTVTSWPVGEYVGQVQLLRGDDVVSQMQTKLTLSD